MVSCPNSAGNIYIHVGYHLILFFALPSAQLIANSVEGLTLAVGGLAKGCVLGGVLVVACGKFSALGLVHHSNLQNTNMRNKSSLIRYY